MTRVWIVNHYAGDPADTASGSRHFSLARRLAQLNWEPVIVAASVEHNTGRQRLTGRAPIGTTRRDGVTFRWLRTSTYSGNSAGRVINILQFTRALLGRRWHADLPAPDVVIGSTVHPLAALAASRIARRYGVPFIFEIRDLWPQTLIDMGKISHSGIVAMLLRRVERMLCDRAVRVVTLLPHAGSYLQERGVPPEKVIWLSNGTDVSDFANVPPRTTDGPNTFLYFGSLGNANGVDAIVRGFDTLMRATGETDARLVIVGSGPRRDELVRLADTLGVSERVEFRPAVPKAEIPAMVAIADTLVLNVLDLPVYRFGISLNKLFDYMASGRPIIMATGASNNPVQDSEGGICVPANDPDSLASAMRQVLDATEEQRAAWGRNAAAYAAANFDYQTLGTRLDGLLREVLGNSAGGL